MGIADFDPGRLSARLLLERPVPVSDGQGGAAETFEVVASVWALVTPLAAKVEERAGAETVEITHEIWVRRRGDLVSGMRFVKGNRHFTVESVRDPDESGRYLACRCREEGR
ncbi:phage head closure protein [Rhizobium sp. S95]|uniref:Phage head closure protein n=1 Tax=Ciceribacter sichuanensis TaxID=2949647 RepID=A0AAJ1BSQ9_9HYPH|nr:MULTISPECIES: phage head closure protein [unclassified Ciceribacter]MCM2395238.1 phage head closure protein [Ciceribacter sp. S95]MCO5955660.1 phage head closure protein [Ciceribacter sp. S101]